MTNQATTTKEALEPCPWCSGKAMLRDKLADGRKRDGQKLYWVMCPASLTTACRVSARTRLCETPEEAITIWNSRVSAPIVAPTNALQELLALFTRDASGHWNFNSLSRDANKLDEVMERLSAAPIVAPEVDQCGACNEYAHKNYSAYKICNNCWRVMPWQEDGRVFEHKPYPYTCAADNEIIVTPAPAAAVAPQQSDDHVFIPPADAKCLRCGLSVLAASHNAARPVTAHAEQLLPLEVEELEEVLEGANPVFRRRIMNALRAATAPASPAALRDESDAAMRAGVIEECVAKVHELFEGMLSISKAELIAALRSLSNNTGNEDQKSTPTGL